MAVFRVPGAGAQQQLVEMPQAARVLGQLGEIMPVLAGGDFVNHFSQAENIRRRLARPFARQIARRAHPRKRGVHARHQPDVRQLGHAVDEDDVGRLDVAMHQAVPVQMRQGSGQRPPVCEAI